MISSAQSSLCVEADESAVQEQYTLPALTPIRGRFLITSQLGYALTTRMILCWARQPGGTESIGSLRIKLVQHGAVSPGLSASAAQKRGRPRLRSMTGDIGSCTNFVFDQIGLRPPAYIRSMSWNGYDSTAQIARSTSAV